MDLRQKLIRMNLISIGVAFVLILIVITVKEVSNFKSFIVSSVTTQATIIGNNSTAALSFSDQKAAEEILSSLKNIPNMVRAVIYTKEGAVFAKYGKWSVETPLPATPQQYGHRFEGRFFNLFQPIKLSNETIGAIYLTYDIKSFYSNLVLYSMLLLFIILVSIMVANLLFSRLQRSITGPISGLVDAMGSISAKKDYSLRVPVYGEGEIGVLTKGFNDMLEQIQKWDHELVLHRLSLEDTVAKRTSELQALNQNLSKELVERGRIEEELRKYRYQLEELVEERTVKLLRVNKELQHEISEREKMEEELLRSRKLESLGILAGGIAHDFNNLLTVILGNISLACRYVDPEKKAYKRLQEAEKATLRTKDLTQQLLTFSKGGEPVKKLLSIGDLVRESAGFVLRGSAVKGKSVIPDDLWSVEADEGQIGQVINNLLINADQAMPEGGIIDITCENITVHKNDGLPVPEGKYVKISIEDRGIGIAEEHLPKIFDPYFTTKQKGSGLGLATTYSIIKKHGGYITVESRHGSGTTFRIYLPAFGGETCAKTTEDETFLSGEGNILVMDDEDAVRDIVSEMLRAIGYEVETARDGNEAITIYQEAKQLGKPFDLLILDLTVPGAMGGRDAIKRLREIDPDVKAVVSSGYSNDPIMANYKEHGFLGVIKKPYELKELSEVVYKVVNLQ